MTDDLTRYTVDVTTALAFGEDPNTLESDGDVIQRHLAQVFPTIMRRVNAPFPWWRHVRLPADRRFDASMAAVHAHVRGLIERARILAVMKPAQAVTKTMADDIAKLGKELGEEAGDDWDEMVEQMMEEEMSGDGEDGEAGTTGAKPKKPDNLGWA